jgi:peptide/nickel transport system ATP-binding protein
MTADLVHEGPAPAGTPLLAVEDLTVKFDTEDGTVNAVRGVSYTLAEREVLGIVGESGSGKSVSSLAVMGLLPQTARVTGRIVLQGQDVLAVSEAQRRSLRGRKVAMIFQDPMTALNPVYTIGDQLAEAMRSHEYVSKKAAWERAAEMLDLVGIPRPTERLRNYPHEFSGGMRQRVMIAMAVINNPDIIIADEPTTALDVTVQAQILEKLIEVKDAVGAAIVLITHDLGVVAGMASRVLVMYAGRAVERGGTEQVFGSPRMPYTAGLLGSIPGLDAAAHRLRPIPGAPPSLINLPAGCPFSPRCPLARDRCHADEPALAATEQHGHTAACHYWTELCDLDDPTTLFRAQEVSAE